MPSKPQTQAGWLIGRSIALELDIALAGAGGYYPERTMPPEPLRLIHSLPKDWLAEYPELIGEQPELRSTLEIAATLAGVLFEPDYSRATLAIRDLSLDSALEAAEQQAAAYDVSPQLELPPAERLADLVAKRQTAQYRQAGFEMGSDQPQIQQVRRDTAGLVQILREGPLHSRFWHWLDRFYYEVYRPWQMTQSEMLDTLEQRVLTVLGEKEKAGEPPNLEWLSQKNPLLRVPELHQLVQAGQTKVFFWIEPFGLFDLWSLTPDYLVTAVHEPGVMYENFQAYADDLARRAQALADPTRLIILRMIRYFSWVNTEMAESLGISRPTVSVHAKILREAGLIRSVQEGREVRHTIEPEAVRQLFRDLEQFLDLPGVGD